MADENVTGGSYKEGSIHADIKVGVDSKSLNETLNKIDVIDKKIENANRRFKKLGNNTNTTVTTKSTAELKKQLAVLTELTNKEKEYRKLKEQVGRFESNKNYKSIGGVGADNLKRIASLSGLKPSNVKDLLKGIKAGSDDDLSTLKHGIMDSMDSFFSTKNQQEELYNTLASRQRKEQLFKVSNVKRGSTISSINGVPNGIKETIKQDTSSIKTGLDIIAPELNLEKIKQSRVELNSLLGDIYSDIEKALTKMNFDLPPINDEKFKSSVESLSTGLGGINNAKTDNLDVKSLGKLRTNLQFFANKKEKITEGLESIDDVFKRLASSSTSLIPVNAILENLNKNILEMNSISRKAITTNARIARGVDKLGDEAQETNKEVKGMNVALLGTGKSLRGISNLLRTGLNFYIFREMFQLFDRAVDKSGDFDKSMTMVKSTFSDIAPDVQNFAMQMNKAFLINPNDVRKSVSMLGNLFKNAGLSMEHTLEMSKVLTMMSYDLGSAFGKSADESITDIRSAIVGQTEAIQKYGIQVEAAYVEQVLLNEGLEIHMNKLSNSEKMMARYVAILAQTSTQQGFMSKMLETTTGQIEALKSSFSYLVSNISVIFKHMFAGVVTNLLKTVVFLSRVSEKLMEMMGIQAELGSMEITDNPYTGVEEGLDNVAEKADKAKRSVASFDEVITLSDGGASKKGSNGVGDTGNLDILADMAKKYSSKFGNFKDMFEFDEEQINRVATKLYKGITFISDNFGTILKTVGAIGAGLLAWKIGTGVLSVFNTISALSKAGGVASLFKGVSVAGAGTSIGASIISFLTANSSKIFAGLTGVGIVLDMNKHFGLFEEIGKGIDYLSDKLNLDINLQDFNGSITKATGLASQYFESINFGFSDLLLLLGSTKGGLPTVLAAVSYELAKITTSFGEFMKQTMLPDYVDITNGVSFEAEEKLKPFIADIDNLAKTISQIWVGALNPSDVDIESIKSSFKTISDELIAEAKNTRDAQLSQLDFVKDSLDPEKYDMLVKEINAKYGEVVNNVTSNEVMVTSTIQKAKEEQRQLTSTELDKIRSAYAMYQQDVTNYASVTEKDVTVIAENLSKNMSYWATTTYDETVKKAEDLKNETIKSAEERYAKEVEVSEKLLAQGKITRKEYDDNIAKAKEYKDATIKAAEEASAGMVKAVEEQAPELAKAYESLGTGWDNFLKGMKSGWDKYVWNPIKDTLTSLALDFKDAFDFSGFFNKGKTNVTVNSYGKVPKYATGGVVTKAHVGMVGEAGAEAIIPLERSAFIDDFASKIASKQSGGIPQIVQNITIKIDSTFDDDLQLREKARKIKEYLDNDAQNLGLSY